MKKSFLLFVGLLLLLSVAGWAQQSGSVKGTIHNEKHQPVPATVYLIKMPDNTLAKTMIADSGTFVMDNVGPGDYTLTVTALGYKKTNTAVFKVTAEIPLVELPAIILPADAGRNLKEISIFGKKPFIEQKIDRTVVNVEAMPSAAGTNAYELLDRLPGVRVSDNGTVSIKGKQGTVIYVDGRPTYLSEGDMSSYLKSLLSANLDKVEIMPNPPAKYDAAGSGGVINIITRKNQQRGFNGNFNLSYGQGAYEKLNGALNLNYRTNKVTLFGNFGVAESKDFEKSAKTRAYNDTYGAVTSRFTQEGFTRMAQNPYTVKLGMDYFKSKRTTFGIVLNGVIRPSDDRGGNITYLQTPAFTIDSSVEFRNKTVNKWKNGTVNLNMTHRLDSAGKEITVDVDYAYYDTDNDQQFDYYTYTPDRQLKNYSGLLGNLPRTINIYSAKVDYTMPIPKGWKADAGLKSSLVKTSNIAEYFSRNAENVTIPDYEKTNTFLYNENINAAYISVNKRMNRLELQLGLRAEQTNAEGRQLGNQIKEDSSFTRHYLDVFPTFYLSYRFDTLNRHQLQLSYGKRINRPSYQMLNPFLSFVDKYYQEAGNPYLAPQKTHTTEVNYIFNKFLTTTLYYDYMINTFNRVMDLSGQNTFINRPANIGKIQNRGIVVSGDIYPLKAWDLFFYVEAGNKRVTSVFNNIDVDSSMMYYSVQLRNQFSLPKGWTIELGGFWSSRDFTGQFVTDPFWELSTTVQKRFRKSSVTLGMRDIFYTRVSKGIILYIPGVDATFNNKRDSRVVTLSYNYRFGKSSNSPRRRKGSAETEQSRADGK